MVEIADILSIFWPFTFAHFAVIASLVVAGIWLLRVYTYHKDPTPDRIADYMMSMPHLTPGQRFKVTLFGLPLNINTELLETFRKVAGNGVADLFIKNRDVMHFYIARHQEYEAGTIKSGLSIIMSNAPLEQGQFYREYSDHRNALLGLNTRLRETSQAEYDGFIRPKARKWKGEVVNLIYYPVRPIEHNPTVDMKKLEMVEVALQVVPTLDAHYEAQQKSQYNAMFAKAQEERAEKAESDARKIQSRFNHVSRQWYKKDYWQSTLATLGSPLSLALVAVIVGGCAVFLPDVLQRQLPGYTQQHYIAFAVGIGLGITWLVTQFKKA